MDDRDAVARDMERIFGPADRPWVSPASGAGLRADRRGHAAAWLAGAMAAIGIVVVGADRLRPPAPVPAAPPPLVRPAPMAVPVDVPVEVEAPTAAAIRPDPRRSARPRRRVRPTSAPRPSPAPTIAAPRPVRLEATRLTGEALRRALAEDVVLTRRLNQQALARDKPPAD